MDIVLASITGISLVLVLVMGAIVFRLQREERLRSEARVALLSAAAEQEIPDLPGAGPLDQRQLFSQAAGGSPWLHRFGAAAAFALVVVLAGYAVVHPGRPAGTQPAPAGNPPLELTSLRHSLDAGVLTISGTLANPPGGTLRSSITATAVVFGPDGSTLARGRAPVDYAMLAAGEESHFEIRVPVQATVTRYRVGFHQPNGSILEHVDRRTDGPSARNGTEGARWAR